MAEFTRVLCPVDLSDASVRPLAYAEAVARWYGGHVTAFHAAPPQMPAALPDDGAFQPLPTIPVVTRADLMHQLRALVAAAQFEESDVTIVMGEGRAADEIVKQAKTMGADLVVMGTHGRSGFRRLVLGSVTEKVLRTAPCPVLTVPPHAPATPSLPPALKLILCAVDFSPASVGSFHQAVDIGRRARASVLVVHSIDWLESKGRDELVNAVVRVDPRVPPEVAEEIRQETIRQQLIDDASKDLAELVSSETAEGCDVTTMVVTGRADSEILRIAEENGADLIAMGAQRCGGAELALFGSTTQQVVRGAFCVVLTVRELGLKASGQHATEAAKHDPYNRHDCSA